MKKTVTFIFLVLFSINSIYSQCTTGNNGTNNSGTYAFRTGQTFQVSCTGLLSTIVFNPTAAEVDDLRDSGFFVGVRLRDNNGAILATATINGASNTDQWFNGATITANFTAANLTLTANTTYRWEVFETSNSFELYLFGRKNSNPYALGNLILNNTSIPGADAEDWTVNVITSSLSTTSFEQENIKIYPNPSTGVFNISKQNTHNIIKIEVLDVTGKLILKKESSANISSVDLNKQNKGIYLLKLTDDDNNIQVMKIIKK